MFKLKKNNTNIRTEIIAGVTTFLAMAYILAVNPSILADAGMNSGAVFTATAVSAAFATLLMGVYANYPVALASGMGLNAYFTYSVCVPMAQAGIQDPWTIALTAILVEGLIFILLSAFKFRETLVNAIPTNLKLGITAGIGLFVALIGFKSAGVVIGSSSTLVDLGDFAAPQVALAMFGLIAIGVMHHFKIKGSILWGILLVWALGMGAEAIGWYKVDIDAGVYSLFPDINSIKSFTIPSLEPTLLKFNFGYIADHFLDFVIIVFAFLFVDLFDTVGTLVGVASKADMLDENGKLPRVGRALMSDAIGTVVGACLGTSTVTSYVESSAGVSEGGRTGLTSVITAIMFIIALFFAPIFTAIPGFATAPALIFVGLLMMSAVTKMKFEGDWADAVGGFLAIVVMPFTYSIANGIMFGMLVWVIIKMLTGKFKEIHPIMYVCGALFAIRIASLIL